jgi:lysophospholipase L1-like esterase
VVTIVILAGVLFIFPPAWRSLEKFDTPTDFRLAYDYRDDYWLFAGWAKTAKERCPVLFLGDSVIWGMYVGNDKTLPARLNGRLEKETVANLAIDGLHSVAMYGLIKHHGSAITNSKVILHLNPLWLSSKRQDLTGDKEFGIHHPRLLPQWFPRIRAYRQTLRAKVPIVGEKYLPQVSLINHLRLNNFDNKNFGQWVVDNPHKDPFSQLSLRIDAASNKNVGDAKDRPQPNLSVKDWPWVALTESLQWKYFVKTVKLLTRRSNKVFVMVGPISPHVLTPESLRRYRTLQSDVAAWLDQHKIDYFAVPDMSSDFYTDASHPTGAGYDVIAKQMLDDDKFVDWIKK